MQTQVRKAKGRGFQQLVAKALLGILKPYGVQSGDIKSTAMGQTGEDLQMSPLAKKYLPISPECKFHAKFAIYNIFEQAQRNCPEGEQPVVFLKANHKKPIVVLDLDYYLQLEESRIKCTQ